MENQTQLTIKEREKLRAEAVQVMRQRFEERKPAESAYTSGESRDAQIIGATLIYAKAAVPVIAILAAIASAVRTVQVVSGIYSDAGSHAIGVGIAALAFTLAAEGALFVLALAQAGETMRRRASKQTRHVTSLLSIWQGLQVRIGTRPAPRYDELPEESGGIGIVIALALVFTLSTNLYMGMKPIISKLGESSLQEFISNLWGASANLQMTFIVDLSAALFAPLVAFAAGHLTARFASEIAERAQSGRIAFDRDMQQWRAGHADPLATPEGQELLNEYIQLKLAAKKATARRVEPQPVEVMPVMNITPVVIENPTPALTHMNGNGAH